MQKKARLNLGRALSSMPRPMQLILRYITLRNTYWHIFSLALSSSLVQICNDLLVIVLYSLLFSSYRCRWNAMKEMGVELRRK